MYYTYVLKCSDDELYIGSTTDLKRRVVQHKEGNVESTKYRLPVKLIYYEACLEEVKARQREKQLKTGFGRAYLNRRLS